MPTLGLVEIVILGVVFFGVLLLLGLVAGLVIKDIRQNRPH